MSRARPSRASALSRVPDYRIEIVPCEDPIRAGFNGTTIAESTRALRVLETGHAPVIYFPRAISTWPSS